MIHSRTWRLSRSLTPSTILRRPAPAVTGTSSLHILMRKPGQGPERHPQSRRYRHEDSVSPERHSYSGSHTRWSGQRKNFSGGKDRGEKRSRSSSSTSRGGPGRSAKRPFRADCGGGRTKKLLFKVNSSWVVRWRTTRLRSWWPAAASYRFLGPLVPEGLLRSGHCLLRCPLGL
jgi:hypothetical protein